MEHSNGETLKVCEFIRKDTIGFGMSFNGPFGPRKVLYCDHTASGKPLHCIEDFIEKNVLPFYGNTHSSITVTAEQSTLFLQEARQIIRDVTGCSDHYVVLYCGSGATSAVHCLVHALNLQHKLIVFVGPFEHHSNLLPWKEIGAEFIRIRQTDAGEIDLAELERQLLQHKDSTAEKIGCFSAASNVTGVTTDTDKVATLLHKYGALSFFDYATGAAYLPIKMNSSNPETAKDAVYFSGHKLLGAVQSPGVLIAKRSLFRNPIPFKPGGGTVIFVRREAHGYLIEIQEREEGGTPDIVGAIRLGLALKLKETLGTDFITQRENQIVSYVLSRFASMPNFLSLGPSKVDKLAIFSLMVRHGSLYLHHSFVCALLDNLFGIQSRAGCACAGPYGLDLLDMSEDTAQRFGVIIGDEKLPYAQVMKPGFVRLNFAYFLTKKDIDFVLDSLAFVAEHGWKFLPQYRVDAESGKWYHFQESAGARQYLGNLAFTKKGIDCQVPPVGFKRPPSYSKCLSKAHSLARKATTANKQMDKVQDLSACFKGEADKLRWFVLPSEIYDLPDRSASFTPKTYDKAFDNGVVLKL